MNLNRKRGSRIQSFSLCKKNKEGRHQGLGVHCSAQCPQVSGAHGLHVARWTLVIAAGVCQPSKAATMGMSFGGTEER